MTSVYGILSVFAGVMLITGPVEPVRYSISALPAYCRCATSLVSVAQSLICRRTATAKLTLAVAWQLWSERGANPARLGGYEEAARLLLAEAEMQPVPTVLYSASLAQGRTYCYDLRASVCSLLRREGVTEALDLPHRWEIKGGEADPVVAKIESAAGSLSA